MPLRWLLAAGFLTLCGPALAQDFTPAKSCTDKTAAPATVNEVASNPAGFKGKCVKVQGWWRDIGIYASRGEAFQPDALSIVTLDERRLGLYLSDKDQAKAPPRAVMGRRCFTAAATVRMTSPLSFGDTTTSAYLPCRR